MLNLEHVKLLETKVTKTIEYVKKLTEENTLLKGEMDSYQKRIDELEAEIKRFKDDQSRIEDGILSALNRLNELEDALESTLTKENPDSFKNEAPEEENDEPEQSISPLFQEEPEQSIDDSNEPEPEEPQEPTKVQGQDNELDIF